MIFVSNRFHFQILIFSSNNLFIRNILHNKPQNTLYRYYRSYFNASNCMKVYPNRAIVKNSQISPHIAIKRRNFSNYPNTEQELEKERKEYRSDFLKVVKWLSLEYVKVNGRILPPDEKIIPKTYSVMLFPNIKGHTLLGNSVSIPSSSKNMKLVIFSFKKIGFEYTRKYIDSIQEKFQHSEFQSNLKYPIEIYDIHFVEHSFLFFLKSLFIKNLQNMIPEKNWSNTILVFGGVNKLAQSLLLPNQNTGYVCLLDDENRIRWRAYGQPTPQDLDVYLRCAEELAYEIGQIVTKQ